MYLLIVLISIFVILIIILCVYQRSESFSILSDPILSSSSWVGMDYDPNAVHLGLPLTRKGNKQPLFWTNDDYDKLKQQVDSYQPNPQYSDDIYLKVCCQEALIAVKEGTFGIGCCLVDTEGTLTGTKGVIAVKGHNQLMYPYFRSDAHGEMIVLDDFEKKLANGYWGKKYAPNDPLPSGLTLYTQLESCVMCLARIANSGIARCLYGAPDNGGGMVHLLCQNPPTYTALLNRQIHDVANVSSDLMQLCMQCFIITGAIVGAKLMQRAGKTIPNYDYCKPMYNVGIRSRQSLDLQGFIRDPGWNY